MNSIKPRVVNTSLYSIGFPIIQEDITIIRKNYIAQIDDYFEQGMKMIFIDGDEDAGKTTLCTQYVNSNTESVISVFFNPLNNLDYSIDFYCSNVVYQLKYLLDEAFELEDQSTIGIELYQQYIFKIRKVFKRVNKPLVLVLDGLENKISENDDFIKQLFAILPSGQESFNILITGSEISFKNQNSKTKNILTKSITVSGFSDEEISKYLDVPLKSVSENKEIYKITKGYPGRLKTLKRLLKNEHYSLDKISTSTSYKNWIELDCSSIDHNKPINQAILSLFALNDKLYSLEEISKICSIDVEETNKVLDDLTVLENNNKYFAFISTAYKKYYSNILRGNKKITQDLLINYYASNESINSLIELPKLYAESRDWSKVLQVIDVDYCRKIIQSTESIKSVNENLAIGLKASQEMNKYTEMWRYSIESSVINEIDNYLFWESEVRARISINDFAGAITLAESALLKVDRLKLLALIARRRKEIKSQVDEDLVDLINQLYTTTDLASVGDKIYNIVADLIYAIPNLAIEIIEKSSGSESDKNINDWIVAKLSIAAIDSSIKDKEELETSKKMEALQNLNNSEAKKINKAITFLVGNYTANKVINEVNKLSDSKERLRLLRLWLTNNKGEDKNIASVIDLALNELISSSDSNTIDVLKEFSNLLPFVKDPKVKDKLYYRFKQIENSLTDIGLSRNRYIYELNLFHTEFTLDKKQSEDSLGRLLKKIDKISDRLIQIEAYAEAYAKLMIINYSPFQLKMNFLYGRLLHLCEELFKSTASHLKLIDYVLKIIGKRSPILGLKICSEINLQRSREKGRVLVYESYLDNDQKYISFDVLKQIEKSFEFKKTKQSFYIDVLEKFADEKKLEYSVIRELFYFADKVRYFKTSVSKVYAFVQIYKIIWKNDESRKRQKERYEGLIVSEWKKIETEWEQIDTGFSICSDISNINQEFAETIFQDTYRLKNDSWIDSGPVASAYINSMILVIRAFSNLLISGDNTKEDKKILTDLMNRIPSESERLQLWTELGFHSISSNNEPFAKGIYNEHIIPLIDGIINRDQSINKVLTTLTFIHLFNTELLNKYLKDSSEEIKESVYGEICSYYVSKRNPYQPYDLEIKSFKCSYSDLVKAISVLNQCQVDVNIYSNIDLICSSILESKTEISRAQNTALLQSLEEIIQAKLPDLKNIKHLGYRIVAEAKIATLKRDNIDHNNYWKNVLEKAREIPNLSDCVFVKAILLEEIPFEKIGNGGNLKTNLFNEVVENLSAITSHYEFVNRVIDLSDKMYPLNRKEWKKVIEKAFTVSELQEGADAYQSQKEMIDSMYRLDPAYAKELIKLNDKESQKNRYAELLSKRIELLEISNKIKNNKALEVKEKEKHKMIVKGLYDTLKSINSEMISAKKLSEVSVYLTIGNKLPFHEAFPIYMYYLTNCAKTYSHKNLTGSISDLHKENFKKAVVSTNLIEILSNRKKSSERSYRNFFVEDDFSSNEAVNPGTRENAFAFIKDWIQDEVTEFIIIADPYLKKEDLEILKIIQELKPEIDINILGSKNGSNNVEAEFKNYWKTISEEQPPFANITFCWIPDSNNDSPFHDRWIITKDGGLRMGTSLNSLGGRKESELSIMKAGEAIKIQENLSEYISRKKKAMNNMRISYKSFSF